MFSTRKVITMAKNITATVKFFNQQKGFGFFKCEDGADIFVHSSVVAASGFSTKNMMEGTPADIVYETNSGRSKTIAINLLGGLKGSKKVK